MKLSSSRHLTLLWLLTLLVVMACVFLGSKAFHSVEDLALPPADSLTRARQAYREIAEHVPIAVHQMNVVLRVYADTGSRTELDRHTQLCTEFRNWLESRRQTWPTSKLIYRQPAKVNLTMDVGSVVEDLTVAFEGYAAVVSSVSRTNRLTQINQANTIALRLLEIAGQAHGRAEAIDTFLSFAKNWSPSYRTLILVTGGILAFFVLWLGFLTYRLSFVPLRQKLVESTATIEQQKKLAHFGELAAGLAHEIRNPLTAINARLYTLQRSIPAGSPEAEDATVINNEITRLDSTVKDFLKLARPAEPLFAPVNTHRLFQEVVDLLGAEFAKHAITITLTDAPPITFSADRQLLKQVLINLLQNAADAIGQTGTITLSARIKEQLLHGRHQEVILLEVEDTGPGIPVEIQDRLFDPFFSTKEHGTGLGLAISARIVAQHHGVLELQSRIGHGAKFSILLPTERPAHAR